MINFIEIAWERARAQSSQHFCGLVFNVADFLIVNADQNQNLLHSLDRTAWLSFMSQAPNTVAGKHHAIVLLLKQQQRIILQPR